MVTDSYLRPEVLVSFASDWQNYGHIGISSWFLSIQVPKMIENILKGCKWCFWISENPPLGKCARYPPNIWSLYLLFLGDLWSDFHIFVIGRNCMRESGSTTFHLRKSRAATPPPHISVKPKCYIFVDNNFVDNNFSFILIHDRDMIIKKISFPYPFICVFMCCQWKCKKKEKDIFQCP